MNAPTGIAKLKCWTCLKLSNTKIHKCKGHNIAENNLTRTIIELDLCILVTHLYSEYQLKIVAAFRGMHVSPAKHSFGKFDRQSVTDRRTDRQTDGQTDDGQSDPYVSLCFAGDTKMSMNDSDYERQP